MNKYEPTAWNSSSVLFFLLKIYNLDNYNDDKLWANQIEFVGMATKEILLSLTRKTNGSNVSLSSPKLNFTRFLQFSTHRMFRIHLSFKFVSKKTNEFFTIESTLKRIWKINFTLFGVFIQIVI